MEDTMPPVKSSVAPRPFVQLACVCEKVLIEPDSVPSLIRVVDTYTIDDPAGLPGGLKAAMPLTIFVSLKSGDVVGEFDVGLRFVQPNGKAHPVRTWPMEFKGNEGGVNLKVDFSLGEPAEGLCWFDVLWGDDVLTRIPLRMKFRRTPKPTAGPTESAEPSIR
jgi:hypothetical protein